MWWTSVELMRNSYDERPRTSGQLQADNAPFFGEDTCKAPINCFHISDDQIHSEEVVTKAPSACLARRDILQAYSDAIKPSIEPFLQHRFEHTFSPICVHMHSAPKTCEKAMD